MLATRPRRALPRIYVAAPLLSVAARRFASLLLSVAALMYPRLCVRKFLRFFRAKSSAAPRFAADICCRTRFYRLPLGGLPHCFYRLPRLRVRKFLRFFRVKSLPHRALPFSGSATRQLAFTPRALPLVFYGAPALPLRSRTEVGRTRLCGLPARLKVICFTFDRKNNFPTVLTAKDPPPGNLSGNL